MLFSVSAGVSKLIHTNKIKDIEIPIIACLAEAISQATGKSAPKATDKL